MGGKPPLFVETRNDLSPHALQFRGGFSFTPERGQAGFLGKLWSTAPRGGFGVKAAPRLGWRRCSGRCIDLRGCILHGAPVPVHVNCNRQIINPSEACHRDTCKRERTHKHVMVWVIGSS